jgi:streptomycin 6-kinase
VVEIPPHVLANWEDWELGDVDALAADVLARCDAAVRAWGLERLQPLPGGEVALVLAASAASGEAVLKLSPRPGDGAPSLEGEALTLWARRDAAPRVLGARDAGTTLLLERVLPGGSLGEHRAGADEVLAAVGGLCARLHLSADDVADAGFPSLADHARDDGWLRALDGTREQGELAALLEPGAGDRLLHIDLHALNVLRGRRGWLAIDPKPCVGDPCAEVYGFLDGAPLDELPREQASARERLRAHLAAYGRASGTDPGRLAVWLRIRAQILLGEGAGPKREALLRLRDALE